MREGLRLRDGAVVQECAPTLEALPCSQPRYDDATSPPPPRKTIRTAVRCRPTRSLARSTCCSRGPSNRHGNRPLFARFPPCRDVSHVKNPVSEAVIVIAPRPATVRRIRDRQVCVQKCARYARASSRVGSASSSQVRQKSRRNGCRDDICARFNRGLRNADPQGT